ncbi:MAG: hypothetical protein DMF47_09665 [Verrucomicrobia bacterium]|nr:MAG: hypothetical protein DMF47_09665 [Verrucomicrobiota bacterium]
MFCRLPKPRTRSAVTNSWENKTASTLPSDAGEQRKLAVRLGYESLDAFREKYVDARESVHALYNQRVKSAAVS